MNENKVYTVLQHAKNLRILILLNTVLYVFFGIWDIYVKDFFIFDLDIKIYHILLIGYPITAYAIWYILNLSPDREHNKTGKVLGLLFFGIIGLWMTYPHEKKLKKRFKAQNSIFNTGV